MEILDAFRRLEGRTGREVFAPIEIIREMQDRGSSYPESTIRTHVVAAMCADAPKNHAVTYDDLERVGRGRYRRVSS